MLLPDQLEQLVQEVSAPHGAACAARARAGITQIAARWRSEDGTAAAFAAFVRARFVGDEARRACLLARLEDAVFHMYGHLAEIRRMLHRWQDVARTDDPGIDDLLAQFSPAPDLREELYRSKLAFVALLIFPAVPFAEILRDGAAWPLEPWAAVRTANAVAYRLPRQLDDQARPSTRRCTHCGTASRRICWRAGMIFAPCKNMLELYLTSGSMVSGCHCPSHSVTV